MARPLATVPAIKPTLRGTTLYITYSFRKLLIRKTTDEHAEENQIGSTGFLKNTHPEHIRINQKLEGIVDRLKLATGIVLKQGDAAVTVSAIEAEYNRLCKEAQELAAAQAAAEAQQQKLTNRHHNLDIVEADIVVDEIADLQRLLQEKIAKRDNLYKLTNQYQDDKLIDFMLGYTTRKGQATMAKASARSYKSMIYTLKIYNADWKIQDVTEQSLIKFQDWLIDRKILNGTIDNYITKIKTVLNFYIERPELLPSHVKLTKNYKLHSTSGLIQKPDNAIALTTGELNELMMFRHHQNYKKKSWDRVLDVFCLMCATGLRVSDIGRIIPSDVKDGYITLIPNKTKRKRVEVRIKLNPYSIYILQKYDFDMSSCKFEDYYVNSAIKEICQIIGGTFNVIERDVNYSGENEIITMLPRYECISNHTGRKTFSTLAIMAGTNVAHLMKQTGHLDPKTLMGYVDKMHQTDSTLLDTIYQLPVVIEREQKMLAR